MLHVSLRGRWSHPSPRLLSKQRGLSAAGTDRRRLAMRRTWLRGSNIRLGRWSTSSPWRGVRFYRFDTPSPHNPPPSLAALLTYPLSFSIPSGSACESPDVLKDDVSSSPAEHRAFAKSPSFSPLPGLSGDQLKSDFSTVGPPVNHRAARAQVRKESSLYQGAAF